MVLDDDPQVLDGIVGLLAAWEHQTIAGTDPDGLSRRHDETGPGVSTWSSPIIASPPD